MRTLVEHLAGLEDPRVARSQRHSLLAVVTIALCAVICGAENWVEIEQFGRAKERWFAGFLELPHGIPSHDTFGRVFARLDAPRFEACFADWMRAVAEVLPLEVVALDGKTLRRSGDRRRGQAALHLVSAWACANRLVLAQVAVADKSNEITAFPALLRRLALAGCLVTIDAMGCQTAIAEQVLAQGADYVLALKDNQPTLYEEVQDSFALARAGRFTEYAAADWDRRRTGAKGHGRLEAREHWGGLADAAGLADLAEATPWPGLRAIGLVEAERRHADGRVAREARSSLLSARLTAPQFAQAVRAHWGSENRLHWLLDVAFREDDSRARVGHSADNLAVLRRMALHLLQQEQTAPCGVKAKRLKAGWSEDYLLQVLAG